MAAFSWTSFSNSKSLLGIFDASLRELGLDVVQKFSSQKQVYAETSPSRDLSKPLVKVIISLLSSSKSQLQVEVRSSESILLRSTRCEEIAISLKKIVPPN